MTPRFQQSPQAFRRTVPWERRSHRPHQRHVHGLIQPMNEDRSGKWFAGFAIAVLAYFIIRLIGG